MNRSQTIRFRPGLSLCLDTLEDRLAPSAIHPAPIAHSHNIHGPTHHALSTPHTNRHNNTGVAPHGVVSNTRAAALPTPSSPITSPAITPINRSDLPPPSSAPANVGAQLGQLYQEYRTYVAAGSHGTFTSSLSGILLIQGNTVGIDVRGRVDASSLSNELTSLGMKVTATDATTKTVEGFLPIGQIAAVGNLTDTVGVSPIFRPHRG